MGIQRSSLGGMHATVLRQHAEIRARLRGLDLADVAGVSPLAAEHLRISLLRLAVLFDAHLAFEEAVLAPQIHDADAWGPARHAAMLAEHVAQRIRMQHVCMAAEDEPTGDLAFAHEVSQLVVSLLDDMAREERELADLERLDVDLVEDQMTG